MFGMKLDRAHMCCSPLITSGGTIGMSKVVTTMGACDESASDDATCGVSFSYFLGGDIAPHFRKQIEAHKLGYAPADYNSRISRCSI